MVNIAGSLLGEMAPAPPPGLTETEKAQARAEESYRQQQIEEALEHLTQEVAVIDKAISAAIAKEVERQEQQIAQMPGKMTQPAMEIAALQAKKDEIQILGVQLAEESKVPGARRGLSQYNNNIGTLYGPPPPEKTYSPRQNLENISFLSAPQTVAQQQAAQQSFNTMDEGIRSAPTPMTQEQQEIAAMMEAEATIAKAEAQVNANNLSAMSMVANQAAAEAFSNAIAEGATVAEATAAAEAAAQTAAQQAATQIGINPNSPTVTEAAMNAVNTQAVEIGRLASRTPEQVAAVAQRGVTAAQQGNIAKSTLNQAGLLGPLGLAITAPEVEARRTREAQAIMERAMLNPAPVSPTLPEQNPLGPARGVSLPARNLSPAFQVPQNQLELNAQPPITHVEPTLLNPNINAINAMMEVEALVDQPPPGLTLGAMPAEVPGFTSPSPVTSMPSALTGFTSPNAPQVSAPEQVSPAASFFSEPEPVAPDATPVGPGTTVSGVQSSVPGISIAPTGMTGVSGSGLSPEQSAQVTRGNALDAVMAEQEAKAQQTAITSMMDVENTIAQQQAKNAITAMMGVEAQLGAQQAAQQAKTARANTLHGLALPEPTPTTSRSSSRGRSGGRSSRGRSSTSAPQSQVTRSVASWGPENQVSFSEEAADTSNAAPPCYIATDAVSAGAFSKLDKAKAELWCKRALHNHWAGETVRLGYQALSKRAVANGTASKHYDEFQRFVRYGRGLDKTLKGAVTFYTRMAQFFAVGVINRLKAR